MCEQAREHEPGREMARLVRKTMRRAINLAYGLVAERTARRCNTEDPLSLARIEALAAFNGHAVAWLGRDDAVPKLVRR